MRTCATGHTSAKSTAFDHVTPLAHDPTTSAPAQCVPDLPAAVELEESSPNPELSSKVVLKPADILQMLQKLQAICHTTHHLFTLTCLAPASASLPSQAPLSSHLKPDCRHHTDHPSLLANMLRSGDLNVQLAQVLVASALNVQGVIP